MLTWHHCKKVINLLRTRQVLTGLHSSLPKFPLCNSNCLLFRMKILQLSEFFLKVVCVNLLHLALERTACMRSAEQTVLALFCTMLPTNFVHSFFVCVNRLKILVSRLKFRYVLSGSVSLAVFFFWEGGGGHVLHAWSRLFLSKNLT